jgi:hypothetical protein
MVFVAITLGRRRRTIDPGTIQEGSASCNARMNVANREPVLNFVFEA